MRERSVVAEEEIDSVERGGVVERIEKWTGAEEKKKEDEIYGCLGESEEVWKERLCVFFFKQKTAYEM